MRLALDKVYRSSGYAAAFFLVMAYGVVLAQVLLNLVQVALHEVGGISVKASIPSYSEFATHSFAAAAFLGLGYTFRGDGHIRVELLSSHLTPRFRPWIEIWCVGFSAVMASYIAYFAIRQVLLSFEFGDSSSGLIAIPLWIPQLGMATGLIVLAIALIDELFQTLMKCFGLARAAISETSDEASPAWQAKADNAWS
jgi:TRAP-type C4-dicarboxylate transport system permease small subunit